MPETPVFQAYCGTEPPRFANPAELEYAKILDWYGVRWQYEPTKVSIEQRRSPAHLEAASAILEKFEDVVREGLGMNWVRQRALCSLYFFVAEHWVMMGDLSAAMQSWRRIRERALGSGVLHVSGALLLMMAALGFPSRSFCDRMINRWKGWMRLKTNPQLVRA